MMKTTQLPTVSVVIPAYNEAHFIAECLESLKNQDYRGKIELIVVDNGSSDATAAIARSGGATVIIEKQKGVCHARQAGTRRASGEIIVSTDADSYYDTDWISNLIRLFEADDTIVAVAGRVRYMNAPVWVGPYTFILFGLVNTIYKLFGMVFYISACNVAFKKAAWQGYNTRLTQGGDELDLLRNLKKTGRVVYDHSICTYTSSRRQVRGFFYNLFVTFLVYYLLDYFLSRFTKRSVFGSYPAYRNEMSPKTLLLIQTSVVAVVVFGFVAYTKPGHDLYHRARRAVTKAPGEIREIHFR